MQCLLCGHPKAYKHGKIASGKQRYHYAVSKRIFTETFDTLYYPRQTFQKPFDTFFNRMKKAVASEAIAHTTGLAYNTVIALQPTLSATPQWEFSSD